MKTTLVILWRIIWIIMNMFPCIWANGRFSVFNEAWVFEEPGRAERRGWTEQVTGFQCLFFSLYHSLTPEGLSITDLGKCLIRHQCLPVLALKWFADSSKPNLHFKAGVGVGVREHDLLFLDPSPEWLPSIQEDIYLLCLVSSGLYLLSWHYY